MPFFRQNWPQNCPLTLQAKGGAMLFRVLIALSLTATQAQSGAWPRGEGNTFVALSYTINTDAAAIGMGPFTTESYGALLVERGVNDRLTFGLDANYGDTGSYSTVVYVSRALGSLDRPSRLALHVGGGFANDTVEDQPQAYLGASWGRGLDTRWGGGWSAVDLSLYYFTDETEAATKADVTLGINFTEDLAVFVQAQAGQYPDSDGYLRVVPSAAYRLGNGPRIELGVPVGLSGDSNVGVKLGTWLEF